MYSFTGKNVIVIGGTSGIGLAVARSFVEQGAAVVVTGRRTEGEQVAKAAGATFIRSDATDEKQVVDALAAAEQALGKLDVAIVNAGCADDEGSIEEFASSGMDAIIDLNLKGTFYALKYLPGHMNDGASIIYTGSVAGSGLTHAGTGVYAASKAGGAYLARTSAIENAPRAIRVNCVCPALIAGTGMMVDDDGGDEAVFLSKLNAFGRMGKQDEVIGIYNFLASDASTFITGQEICVDGGMSAGLGLPLFQAIG